MNFELILASDNVASITPAYAIAGTLYVSSVVRKGNATKVVPAVVVDGGLKQIPFGVSNANVSPVGGFAYGLVCTVVVPRKPQTGCIMSFDGTDVIMLEIPVGKCVNVFPFWVNHDCIMGKIMDTSNEAKTGVWDIYGKLVNVLDGTYIGKIGKEFVKSDIAIDYLPYGYSLPLARSINGSALIGTMFLNGKRTNANSNSWVCVDGKYEFIIPTEQPFTRFIGQRVDSTGRFVFGLAFNPDSTEQWDVVYDVKFGQFRTLQEALGVALNSATLVIDGNVIYGRGMDGLYKVEGWC